MFFCQIGPDEGMRSFHLVVYSLADIMEQSGSLGLFHIQPQLSRHHTAQKTDLSGVLEHILSIT